MVMTYDERQEIEEYLRIVKRNCERLMRSIEMMQNKLGEIKCETDKQNAKEEFLKNY
jgi:hypothetical protein